MGEDELITVLLAMMVLAMLRVLPRLLYMPPPSEMPLAELPERVEFISVTIALVLWLNMPPPKVTALLAENVELLRLEVLFESLKMPPPKFALLPEMVELETVRAPLLKIPPPKSPTILPEMVELAMLRVPELLKPPPLPEEIFAPETVTPEMVKLPPMRMVKILKPPMLPSIVSEEALGPVMFKDPEVNASKIFGNAAVKAMVPVTPVLKTISSLAEVRLAVVMASLSEIPE